ncbi:hypothetical protein LTR05_007154 [Lithohypha guttulata]|uniref:Cytochrome P450 n=1 Tax=Lithohypha guttulata TaxID=1690604 RepID=A0AAN7SUL2_9EURO|nr:hypothetical protein LTR05_007154 [Lithohypha guttulata]
MSDSYTVPLGALTLGSLSYWTYFQRGEHFLYAVQYIQGFAITVLAGAIFFSQQADISFLASLSHSIRLSAIFLAGLYANCAFYRLFLNPLNKFPGPYFARLTKFNHCFRNAGLDAYKQFLNDHQKYNTKFLRIGPNDLSVVDVRAVQIVSAADSKCVKSPWYQNDYPLISLHTTRDRAMHDRRRRVWAPAFSDKALRGYEQRVQRLNDLLITKLDESKGSPLDATNLLNLYSFDTMGDLAFGNDFGMLESGKPHWAIKLLNEGMDPLGLQLPVWFFRTLAAIPGLAAGYWKFIAFCTQQLENRIAVHGKTDPNKPDITQSLIDHYLKSSPENKKELWPMLCGDSRLIIVAGSDTTAATLSYLFYHIASKKDWQEKLRKEIQDIKASTKSTERTIADQSLKDAPVLNGMINEALRLNPPVPSGVFRQTPPEGVTIGETFIPGNSVIQIPTYVMSRSEDNYVEPAQFMPERWSSRPELIKEKDAFIPFSTGPFGCIGKNLAYMEIRTITSQIIDQFDVSLAPGEDGRKLVEEAVDHFTLGLKPLMLEFRRRN